MDPSISLLTAAADVISRREWSLQVQHGSEHSPDHLYNWQLIAREDVICRKTKNPANHVRIIHKTVTDIVNVKVSVGCLHCVPGIYIGTSEG